MRISGFFRDAFPAQIDLFDSAIRAVGALDEPFSLLHEGNRLELPSWRFEQHTVWGMTHRILVPFLDLIG